MKKPDFRLCLYESIDECLDGPVSMAVANVQANCRACRSDEFKAHTATDWIDDNSAITEFIVAQTLVCKLVCSCKLSKF